jgi:hypothetical protein
LEDFPALGIQEFGGHLRVKRGSETKKNQQWFHGWFGKKLSGK